ncbi:glycosyltransferase [Phocaeicola sp.]
MDETIFVLHEYGAPEHYIALEALAQRYGMKVKYREFNYLSLLKCWMRAPAQIKVLQKLFVNLWFILSIPYIKHSKIVLGIAPYNKLLVWIMHRLKRHSVYYHTSYSCWNGEYYAHKPLNVDAGRIWREFTNNYVKHIFTVSQKARCELIDNNFATPQRISVVNHSYKELISADKHKRNDLTFIYCGRIIPDKGIEQMLQFFSLHPRCSLTIIGRGEQESLVKEYALKYSNIYFEGYISGLQNIIPHYRKASYVLLNSQRNAGWEELFGITLIEGMACGCVPICTDHSGPLEIVTDHVNGIICHEGEITKGIEEVLSFNQDDYDRYREAAIAEGRKYYYYSVAEKWMKLFE